MAEWTPEWFGKPMRGTCSVCREEVTVPMATGDDRPEDHDAACRKMWERGQEARSRRRHPSLDLWDREEVR